jgi:hypothetical protein
MYVTNTKKKKDGGIMVFLQFWGGVQNLNSQHKTHLAFTKSLRAEYKFCLKDHIQITFTSVFSLIFLSSSTHYFHFFFYSLFVFSSISSSCILPRVAHSFPLAVHPCFSLSIHYPCSLLFLCPVSFLFF